MLFIDVFRSLYDWIGLLVARILWKLTWWLLVPWKLLLMEASFRLVTAQAPLGSASEVHDIFNFWPQGGSVTKGNSNRLYVLRVKWSLTFGRSTVRQTECWKFIKTVFIKRILCFISWYYDSLLILKTFLLLYSIDFLSFPQNWIQGLVYAWQVLCHWTGYQVLHVALYMSRIIFPGCCGIPSIIIKWLSSCILTKEWTLTRDYNKLSLHVIDNIWWSFLLQRPHFDIKCLQNFASQEICEKSHTVIYKHGYVHLTNGQKILQTDRPVHINMIVNIHWALHFTKCFQIWFMIWSFTTALYNIYSNVLEIKSHRPKERKGLSMMKNEAQKEHRAPFKVKYLCINLTKWYKEN